MQNFTFELTEPWKRWETVNISNTSEIIKMMYDVDVEHRDHATAWKVHKHLLLQVEGAQIMIAECDERMKEVTKQRTSTSSWKKIARTALQAKIEKDKALANNVRKEMSKAETKFYDQFGGEIEEMKENNPQYGKYAALQKQIKSRRELLAKTERDITFMESRLEGNMFSDTKEEALKMERELHGDQEGKQGNDEGEWKRILKTILRTVLLVDTDGTAETEWNIVCKKRMKATVEEGITELQLAERLQRETRLYEWGMALYNEEEGGRTAQIERIGYVAWQVFYNNCRKHSKWGHLVATNATNGKGAIEKVIQILRQEDRTLHTKNREQVANLMIVAAAKTKMKTTKVVQKKGSFAESTEEQEPDDDMKEEEAGKKDGKKKGQPKKDTKEDKEELVSAVLKPTAGNSDTQSSEIIKMMQQMQQSNIQVQQQMLRKLEELQNKPQQTMTQPMMVQQQPTAQQQLALMAPQQQLTLMPPPQQQQLALMAPQPQQQLPFMTPQQPQQQRQRWNQRQHNRRRNEGPQGGRQMKCGFFPCKLAWCTREHEPGQREAVSQSTGRTGSTDSNPLVRVTNFSTPTGETDARLREFRDKGRCKFDHDYKGCSVQPCRYAHGRCAQSNEKCPQTGIGMCEAFFTPEGCPKDHMNERNRRRQQQNSGQQN